MLGEMYEPKGLALEQAQTVLECERPYAINVAWGCSNACLYCYGPLIARQSRESWKVIREPKTEPSLLVERQIKNGLVSDGVFLSFGTDPFLPINIHRTEDLIDFLLANKIKVATSSKIGVSKHMGVRHGMTIVSMDQGFSKYWEPNAPLPEERVSILKQAKDNGDFTWVSMEPYPPPAIWKQDALQVLKSIDFVDLVIFGRWRYDQRAGSKDSIKAYKQICQDVSDFCKSHGLRLHVKSDTLNLLKEV